MAWEVSVFCGNLDKTDLSMQIRSTVLIIYVRNEGKESNLDVSRNLRMLSFYENTRFGVPWVYYKSYLLSISSESSDD